MYKVDSKKDFAAAGADQCIHLNNGQIGIFAGKCQEVLIVSADTAAFVDSSEKWS